MQATEPSAQSAFSLMELIVCLSLVSVLLTLALPSLHSFVRNQRTVVEVNLLVGALNYTRSEAAMQRRSLRLCAASPSGGCTDKPLWQGDWLLLADAQTKLSKTPAEPLMVFAHSSEFVWRWRGAGGKPFIRFKADGSAAGRNGTFTLCQQGEALHQVVVNFAGRIRSQSVKEGVRCD